ncbi:alpha/beta hydrolase [Variovorax soli]|uniref:Arylformamidase n=1 Tax=Variovorax soli TaxID=376815 RepID=A0ABU1NCA8_9BURK|nr:alpha/beta hydrolase [Variovorax soli]MDR6536069.1 arylformamidase [Variovorax soli]
MNDDFQYQYVHGQARPGFPALLADYEARSRAAVAAGDCVIDLRYGPHPRQSFDFFPARGRPHGTLAYFHAGYWQSRDKSTFRFVAPAYAQAGIHVALVNYPLCPEVSVAALVEAARACVPAIRAQAGHDGALVLAGHSAGAHIAVELALAQRDGATPFAGVAALSGIYDLAPLVETTLNDKLQLDAASARACSPLHRVHAGAAPALVVVGEAETPAFVAQSRDFHAAWSAAGNRSALHIEPGADHFSLLEPFASAGSALFRKVLDLFAGARDS